MKVSVSMGSIFGDERVFCNYPDALLSGQGQQLRRPILHGLISFAHPFVLLLHFLLVLSPPSVRKFRRLLCAQEKFQEDSFSCFAPLRRSRETPVVHGRGLRRGSVQGPASPANPSPQRQAAGWLLQRLSLIQNESPVDRTASARRC